MKTSVTSARAMRSLIHPLASIMEPLELRALLGDDHPVEVDLGSGDGGFLLAYATAHRDRNFIGVERLLGRLRKIDRKAQRAGLEHVRLIRLEASYLVQYLLPPASVAAIHIYFPDPWPKRRHWPRRLINPDFARQVWRALAPGGCVYLRTDNEDYYQRMLAAFADGFQPIATPDDLGAYTTDFERDFRARGVPTLYAAYQKTSHAPPHSRTAS